MIRSGCQNRTALEGVALLAFVEAMHGGADGAAARGFKEPVGHSGFSKRAAATYELHAEQDSGHGDRQIAMIHKLARDEATQAKIRYAVRLGCGGFNFEWGGEVPAQNGPRGADWSA